MPVNPGFTTTIPSGQTYYRITSVAYKTPNPVDYRRVVDGQGAVHSRYGARYNYPGVLTVYLTEDLETCFAEKMFYFHREVVRGIDQYHNIGVLPPFQQSFMLWEVVLTHSVSDVFDMNIPGAANFFNIFPSLPLNPSQDYDHLKDKRAAIQHEGYKGIRVGSSRVNGTGNLIILFQDQSSNVQQITPYEIDCRLVNINGTPFYNHATEILDFTAGEVTLTGSPMPAGGAVYSNWHGVNFKH
jgi:hypothetical protein